MQLIKIKPFLQPEVVETIASVYQEAFGGEPWNEGYLCPVCERLFPRVIGHKICPLCMERSQAILLVEYWPMSKIISDFYHEISKPESICIVAKTGEKIIGFTWGYRVSVNPDLDLHLDAPALHKSLKEDYFYLDECAITPSYQGRGIGKMLVGRILNEQQQGQILLRTMNNSRMCNLVKHMGGEVVQFISRGRVIMKLLTS